MYLIRKLLIKQLIYLYLLIVNPVVLHYGTKYIEETGGRLAKVLPKQILQHNLIDFCISLIINIILIYICFDLKNCFEILPFGAAVGSNKKKSRIIFPILLSHTIMYAFNHQSALTDQL